MLTINETLKFIAARVEEIYRHPTQFVTSADALDLILHYYHELWSMITGQHEQYLSVRMQVACQEEYDAALFSNNYALRFPNSSEIERMNYSISRWQEIDKLMNFQFPYD